MSAPISSIPDPSMYLRVKSGRTTIWYVINSTTPDEEHLRACLPPLPKRLLHFGCGVVGPVIYVAGGKEMDDDSLHNEVHYIDTRHPDSGWKKGCPMEVPRYMPHLVTVDCKLYAFGGIVRGESSYAEVFDESKSRWNALESLSSSAAVLRSFPAGVSGAHVVSDKNNMMKSMILFHGEVFPSLSRYNIELDSWDTFSESSLGIGKETSALVDGILYCLDWRKPGYMFGLDISDPENKLQKVLGFESVEWMPLPQPDYENSTGPPGFLVSLGESKLAVLWGASTDVPGEDTFVVSYSVLNMSKRLNRATDRFDFVAHTLSVSYYYMSGYRLMSCLPV